MCTLIWAMPSRRRPRPRAGRVYWSTRRERTDWKLAWSFNMEQPGLYAGHFPYPVCQCVAYRYPVCEAWVIIHGIANDIGYKYNSCTGGKNGGSMQLRYLLAGSLATLIPATCWAHSPRPHATRT